MEKTVSSALAQFAFTFCNELDKNTTTVCSPLSAEILLAVTALGCKGRSHMELMQALGMSDDEALRSTFVQLTSTLCSVKRATVNMANKVFLEKGQLKPGIEKDAKKVFKSSLKQLDFSNKENAARVINKWVAKKTNSPVKDVISAEKFHKNNNLVLVNAIYFKGKWKIPFSKRDTKDRHFYVNQSTKVEIPMMSRENVYMKCEYISQLKAKVLEMDYRGNQASMVVVLPDDIEGLSGVLQQLAGGYDLMADVGALRTNKIDVMIPKFKVETTLDLKEILLKLGIKSIFDEDNSEIDMLTSSEKLVVSEAVQKASFAVDESSTIATVSTTMMYRMLCRGMYFTADRPFLYMLTVRKIPLFVGVYRGE